MHNYTWFTVIKLICIRYEPTEIAPSFNVLYTKSSWFIVSQRQCRLMDVEPQHIFNALIILHQMPAKRHNNNKTGPQSTHFAGKKVHHHFIIVNVNVSRWNINRIAQMPFCTHIHTPFGSSVSFFLGGFFYSNLDLYSWYLTIKDYNLVNLRKIYSRPILWPNPYRWYTRKHRTFAHKYD